MGFRQGRSQSNFGRSRSIARTVTWSAGPNGLLTAVGDSSNNLFNATAVSASDNQTIVRTRGRLLLYLTAAAGIDQGEIWAFGICVVTENAVGVGITAVPDPIADMAWDGWLVYEQGVLLARDATPLTDAPGPNSVQYIEIDSKAMRKLHESDSVVGVLANTEIGGSSTMSADLQTRILTKDPGVRL